jgi:osmoprotectant transport system substrate-binding protein
MRRDRVRSAISLLVVAALMTACGGGGGSSKTGASSNPKRKATITVGVSGAFAENQIVAEMYAQVLEKAGYDIKRQLNLERREISQPAIEKGEIQVKPEYLSSLLVYLDSKAQPSSDPADVAAKISKLLEGKNVTILKPSPANDTNAIVVTGKTAKDRSLAKVSDLKPIAGQLIFGGPPECPSRPFCIPGLKDKYGITFKEFKPIDTGALTVAALEGGQIDVALMFSTSSVIGQKGFVALEDDQGLQNADNIVPEVNKDILNDEVTKLLNGVSEVLTTQNITQLNGKVEIDHQDPAQVAKTFLTEKGLL